MPTIRRRPCPAVVVRALAIAALGLATGASAVTGADEARLDREVALGRAAFLDPSLSASGRLACATCHDPRHAFAPANGRAVQLGGADRRTEGGRAVPSLMYLRGAPPFVERRFGDDDGGSDDDDATPNGGLTWDGRVDTLRDQARLPLFDAREMANESPAALAARVRAAPWAAEFAQVFGAGAPDFLDRPDDVVRSLTRALEAYQQRAPEFQPFSSRFDAWLRHEAPLSATERRGLALFDDPRKGNCAGCHPDTVSQRGAFPVFTDFGHVAVGAPRNMRLAANRDPAHFDLGLCGPERSDLRRHAEFCGAFITPTLRNVATRRVFFHNGVFRSLREVVEFYASRDTDPARWYPRDATGRVRRFDDLPAAARANVDTQPPFAPAADGRARLDAREIDAIVAFLKTLTDGTPAPIDRATRPPPGALLAVGSGRHPQAQESTTP